MYYLYQAHLCSVTAFDVLPEHLKNRVGSCWQANPTVNGNPAPYSYLVSSIDDLHNKVPTTREIFPADVLASMKHGESSPDY